MLLAQASVAFVLRYIVRAVSILLIKRFEKNKCKNVIHAVVELIFRGEKRKRF